ncbi:hypothetical protein [Actinomadura madurae]|uniref:hypothetical protein n=1 Tax=Actinomadura madurae TaxID=1993 RepID=UPI0020D2360A|nr:hypothetical protein [Actinomadura madurae]MCP9983317.1 hypothetical protein [Actinomadura madurae]
MPVQPPQFLALPVQPLEALRDLVDLALAERRERAGQQVREQAGVEPLGELRGAELPQRGEQRVVALLGQPAVERPPHGRAVRLRRLVHLAVRPDGFGEMRAGEGLAAVADQVQPAGDTDALAGAEIGDRDVLGVGGGLKASPAREPA